MTAILGLLEALEAAILESPKIPFTDKTIIEENKILEIIDKIRMALASGADLIQSSISKKEGAQKKSLPVAELTVSDLKEARQAARELRFKADKYADEVLSNLAATAAKILRSVESGRQRLSKLSEKTIEEPFDFKDIQEEPGKSV